MLKAILYNLKKKGYAFMVQQGGIWPTEKQELLLRASLLQGQAALDAWRKWETRVDVKELDHASRRLLPLFYRNLERQGITFPVMDLYKGIYRLTWYENQMLFHAAASLLHAFHEAGIETIVLKGAVLALEYYKDPGLRPMGDFDVLIHPKNVLTAVSLLRSRGWLPKSGFPKEVKDQFFSARHAHGFYDAAGHEFDLHWHVLAESCEKNADDDFWNGAIRIQINDVLTYSLNPTDLFLHVCSHGLRWNNVPPFRWVADAMTILNTSSSKIDWDRLIVLSRRLHLVLPLQEALRYLVDLLGAAIPQGVLRSLSRTPIPEEERRFYKIRMQPMDTLSPYRMLTLLYLRYSQATYSGNSELSSASFLRYLQMLWGVDCLWQVPFYAVLKAIRRIWRSKLWRSNRLIRKLVHKE